MLKFLILINVRSLLLLGLLSLLKIFVAMLGILLLRLNFERFLLENLGGSVGPLHGLLVQGGVGIVHGRVPCRHGLPVHTVLLLLLDGLGRAVHPEVVTRRHHLEAAAPAIDLLGDHPLGGRDHRPDVLRAHVGDCNADTRGLSRLPR